MIVSVNKENLSEAAKVYMDSWKESHKDICSAEFIEKHDLEYMKNYLNDKLKDLYVIYIYYADEIPVGIVGINPTDEEICLLYVSPENQGKGYGTKLLSHALSLCKNPYITVLDTNTKAIDFYLKRGFVPAEEQAENSNKKKIFERKYVYLYKNM
ncbi:MAG: GNAT family N-acetyltransferase [Oscillospiraceae bacterium]|nr:GNAT family N-acetyltransferase [Oscillospiraceae bacterium]